ncbi:DUF2971 domain-containing protein [Thalassolituus alkanivorans]|uniref:DUF2971 domain-containing protein n=1 Tax=Thalassolituus alkanivorans TaxID=2881055 RepID=UPI001E64AA79|nr:DUF2971 domain-containing protein [Thalassolituus alkanivorans]MCB2421963.1 DUF2971 domain-containing protein [Thalassolituus alkanivorans]
MNIYQYTDLNAAKNILSTGRLWATHYRYLNDKSEVVHGVEILVDSVADEKKLSEVGRRCMKENALSRLDELNIFVSSLCLAGDELTMWRTYGKCAIVFDMSLITLAITCDGSFRQNSVMSCIYPKSPGDVALSSPGFLSLPLLYEEYFLGLFKERFISSLVYSSIAIKHPSFYTEQEHRVVVSLENADNTPIFYRDRNGIKVPYIELVLPQSCIRAVVIGPGEDQDDLALDMDQFLASNRFDHLKVYKSSIPFTG